MAHWDGAQGQAKMAKIKTQKTPLLETFPPEKLKPKTKICFFDFDFKTCLIRRGFEQLSSSIAWWVIGLQSSPRKVAHVGLKGLKMNNTGKTKQKNTSTASSYYNAIYFGSSTCCPVNFHWCLLTVNLALETGEALF